MDTDDGLTTRIEDQDHIRTSTFRYLGSTITADGRSEKRKGLHNAVTSVAIYGSEFWPMTKNAERRFVMIEAKMGSALVAVICMPCWCSQCCILASDNIVSMTSSKLMTLALLDSSWMVAGALSISNIDIRKSTTTDTSLCFSELVTEMTLSQLNLPISRGTSN
ncbi:hypothetical protein GJ496_003210 [Pomphorhynchus laevis]|nr:hypothetical protein GJ496_003210 [Pomphorhynchus laevis]